MHAGITRRDFLDGVAITALGALAAGSVPACAPHHLPTGAANTAAYPPATTGLWGQDNSSYAVMHKLRDGTFWTHTKAPSSSGEHYDLVIVGAGMSGLASAYFYRQQRPNARILILDVRRDFGGHAGRNEFRVGDRLLLSNAGTQSMESPSGYRPSRCVLSKNSVSTSIVSTNTFSSIGMIVCRLDCSSTGARSAEITSWRVRTSGRGTRCSAMCHCRSEPSPTSFASIPSRSTTCLIFRANRKSLT